MTTLFQDVRYALRRLRNSPGFTIVAVITLALGIGANAVVFSAINSLLLRRLPIWQPDRVFFLESPGGDVSLSYPDYRDLRDRNSTFSGLFTYRINVAGFQMGNAPGNQAERVWLYETSANYFRTLGINASLGRFFTPEEDRVPDANPVAVISYASWASRFHSDPQVLGKTIALNKHLFTIIGVAPRGFHGTELLFAPEIWVPISMVRAIENWSLLEARGAHGMWVAGRLKDGVTPQQATANLNLIAQQLSRQYPGSDTNLRFQLTRPGLVGNMIGRPMKAFLWGLSLLAGLVLLAACTNLGSLLAAQVADRYRELGIRIAVGAGRATILQQLLTEAALLALAGGAVGVAIDVLLVGWIGRIQLPMDLPLQVVVSSDSRVLFFALLISLATTLVFGIAPARQIWRTDPNEAVKASHLLNSVGHRWALRDALLGLQVAICCVLVTACFTSLRGLTRALHTSFGFDPHQAIVAGFSPALDGHTNTESAEIQRSIVERVAHLPGVVSASYANSIPLSLDISSTVVYNDKVTDFNNTNGVGAEYFSIAPGYLSAAGTRLLAGRDVRWEDDPHGPPVAIVNETFARRVVGRRDAVGEHFRQSTNGALTKIIGVVEDGKYEALTEESRPAVFFPITQLPSSDTMLVVRSQVPNASLMEAIRRVIRQQDPAMPVYSMGPWEEMMSYALFPARAATVALSAFGILGLLLAITGIYGLAAYTVARRMRELGIRIALGAQQRQVLCAALGRTFLLVTTGSVVGLAVGVAAGKVLAQIVYQASAGDPLVLISVALTMALVGLVSVAIPARRAVTVDAMRLLRQE